MTSRRLICCDIFVERQCANEPQQPTTAVHPWRLLALKKTGEKYDLLDEDLFDGILFDLVKTNGQYTVFEDRF